MPSGTSLTDRLALRPAEAAVALGISERKLRELLPELPHLRRGGVVLVPVDSLREWLRAEAVVEGNKADVIADEVLKALGDTGR